jgi:hypothetical protein
VEHVADRQAVEQRCEVSSRRIGFRADAAAKADRRLPDRLDALVPGIAGLLAQHVAEQPAEQARVVPQRAVALGVVVDRKRSGVRVLSSIPRSTIAV